MPSGLTAGALLALIFFALLILLAYWPIKLLKWILAPLVSAASERPRLLWQSHWSALGAGSVATSTYVAILGLVSTENLPLLFGQLMPSEIGAALTLLISMGLLDFRVWRRNAGYASSFSKGLIWIVGSNLWISWALYFMWLAGSWQLTGTCYYATVDNALCLENSRAFWSEHQDLWDAARTNEFRDMVQGND